MSVQALYTAATGMESMETKLDVIANNLANINTVGFKKGRANFEDLFYRHYKLPGAVDAASNPTATGTSIGLGTRVSSVQTDHRQGAAQHTGNPLDLMIEGNGFFQVKDPNGETLYSRAGNFSLNANQQIVMGSAGIGRLLEPPIQIPQGGHSVTVGENGDVTYLLGNSTQRQSAGQLQVATFLNPEGLLKLGENLFAQTDSSSSAQLGTPGTQGFGRVFQNTLEASNVEPVQELIDLITTQRSFELNAQVVQAGDQVLQLISNLRRG